jgi:serine/threonine protein kinase
VITGQKIERYEIQEKIGSGGMGEVYLGRDTELERSVALKVMSAEFCCDRERVQRFRQEARAISALNHPHILTIYEIGEDAGQMFIATEYVDGETLRNLVHRKHIDLGRAVGVAEQIARALDAAHRAGIIHRDIKPENVMIRRDGIAKVLDFGLAKPLAKAISPEAATLQLVETQSGLVMGSVGYMSPEQARGKELDERTDVWSLGAVLYEMTTGIAPFTGETVTDTLANVIHKEPPPINDFVADAPAELQRIIKKALRKDREERYQTAKDLALDLHNLARDLELGHEIEISFAPNNEAGQKTGVNEAGGSTGAFHQPTDELLDTGTIVAKDENHPDGQHANSSAAPARKRRISLAFAGIVAVILLGGLSLLSYFYWLKPKAVDAFRDSRVTRLSNSGKVGAVDLSPDGKYLAYVDGAQNTLSRLVLRQIETGSEQEISPLADRKINFVRFSPDGLYLYFTQAERAAIGASLYRITALGGEPKLIASDIDSGPSFSPDGKKVIFYRNLLENAKSTINVIPAEGGEETNIPVEYSDQYRFVALPQWSPDGETIALVGEEKGRAIGDAGVRLLTMPAPGGAIKPVGASYWKYVQDLRWFADGSGLAVSGVAENTEEPNVWSITYPSGEARPITEGVNTYGMIAVSADSRSLATVQKSTVTGIWEYDLIASKARQLTANDKDNKGVAGLAATAEGKVFFTKPGQKTAYDLWQINADGDNPRPLLANGNRNFNLTLSQDGKRLFFESLREGGFEIAWINLDGSDYREITRTPETIETLLGQSGDGKNLFCLAKDYPEHQMPRMIRIDLETGATAEIAADKRQYLVSAMLSPDGKRMLHVSAPVDFKDNAIPQNSLYHSNVEGDGLISSQKLLNVLNGRQYRWTRDGKSIFYIDFQNNSSDIWRLDPLTGKSEKVTNFGVETVMRFAVSPDGKKLYLVRGSSSSDAVLIRSNSS